MIRRMTRRVQRDEPIVASCQHVFFFDGLPGNSVLRIFGRPGMLEKCRPRVRRGQGGRAGGVIAMAVRDDNAIEARAVVAKRGVEVREMARLADARVDERRGSRSADQQIGIVPAAGHRAGIMGAEENRGEHSSLG